MGKAVFPHAPVREKSCLGCHNPHGSAFRNFVRKERAALCYTCHEGEERQFQAGTAHFPVANGECLVCHDPHQSSLAFHLRGNSVEELCAGCHDDLQKGYHYMHEPVAVGDCIACHNPHASKNDHLLYAKVNKTCFSCHSIMKEEFDRNYIHAPASQDCTLCHDPHGAAAAFQLKTRRDASGRYVAVQQPLKDSCMRCHRQSNPELADLEKIAYPHKPAADGQCTACHAAHASNFAWLMKAPLQKVCFSCHRKIKQHISESRYRHGPVQSGECHQCHDAHGSNFGSLLRSPFDVSFGGNFDRHTQLLSVKKRKQ